MKLRTTLALAAAAIPLAAVQAQTLKIGLSAEPTSADPHYHKMTQNDAFSAHVYSSLVGRSADMKLVPALATSWKNLDDLTWNSSCATTSSSRTASPSRPRTCCSPSAAR